MPLRRDLRQLVQHAVRRGWGRGRSGASRARERRRGRRGLLLVPAPTADGVVRVAPRGQERLVHGMQVAARLLLLPSLFGKKNTPVVVIVIAWPPKKTRNARSREQYQEPPTPAANRTP